MVKDVAEKKPVVKSVLPRVNRMVAVLIILLAALFLVIPFVSVTAESGDLRLSKDLSNIDSLNYGKTIQEDSLKVRYPDYDIVYSGTVTVTPTPAIASVNYAYPHVTVSPSEMSIGQTLSITLSVTDNGGSPVSGAGLVYKVMSGSETLLSNSVTTGSQGFVTATYSPVQAGSFSLDITSITPPSGYSSPQVLLIYPQPPYASAPFTVTEAQPTPTETATPATTPTITPTRAPVTPGILLTQSAPEPGRAGGGAWQQDTSSQGSSSSSGASSGGSGSSQSGAVAVSNNPPKGSFTMIPLGGDAPLNVSFDASASSDTDGYITSWIWDFGDGTTGSGKTVKHLFTKGGTITVTLLVKDNLGVGSSVAQQIPVKAVETPQVTPSPAGTPQVVPVVPSQPGGLPDWLPTAIAAVIGVILAAGIIYYLLTRENLTLKPQKKSVPCDGSSTIPIQVSFNNSFGLMRSQKKDREVTMTTTAGTIANVIIPKGKAMVEAILTASTEGGPVKVTAQENRKKAEVNLAFECVEAGIEITAEPGEIIADGISTAMLTIKILNDKGKFITSQNERKVSLTATLGNVSPSVTIPPRTLSGSASFTSGTAVGKAIITGTTGQVSGRTEIILAEPAKRFCMHCGTPMGLEVPSCPKCGNTPPSGVDTKLCSTCEAVLPITAKFCDKCGARQPALPDKETT
jgi:ribosomal protein L40E/uncharacterized membrane protein YgcG